MLKHLDNQGSLYVIVWEFDVRVGLEAQFEQAYGPEGDWAKFFRRDPNYVGTELIRDAQTASRYLTVDVWRSEAAYEAFREKYSDEYNRLDQSFESLTERETCLGTFHTLGRSKIVSGTGSN